MADAAVAVAVTADSVADDALPLPLDFDRLDTGSRVTIRALGAGKGAMSIFSNRLIRLRHERVGFIVVGLVRVDVSM